jgi:hypothetical protein
MAGIDNFPNDNAAILTITAIVIPRIAVSKFASTPFKPNFANIVPSDAMTAPSNA